MGMTWNQISADPVLAGLPHRVESDKWGNIVLRPPPNLAHSRLQSEIVQLLDRLMVNGTALVVFPLSTADGVKSIDAVWISDPRLERQPDANNVSNIAPEICVEVVSSSHLAGEIETRMRLYFRRGADECWTCNTRGGMKFFNPAGAIPRSELCPKFPANLKLTKRRSE